MATEYRIVTTRLKWRPGTREILRPLAGDKAETWLYDRALGAWVYQGRWLTRAEFEAAMSDPARLDGWVLTLNGAANRPPQQSWKVEVRDTPKPEKLAKARAAASARAGIKEGDE